MKLENLTVIFIIIIIPIIILMSAYISTGLKTLRYQSLYDSGLLSATHDAIYAFEKNTRNNDFSDNPQIKRDVLKASVKMFEKSLATTCGIAAYDYSEIEEYIPAIVFGMYDGFYMYAPSLNAEKGKYEHGLKNYVYYSEVLDEENNIVIRYSLDNYVVVSGKFGKDDEYITKEGYLVVGASEDGKKYQGIDIVEDDAINYYKKAVEFTNWFNDNLGKSIKDESGKLFLQINNANDPEYENSLFVQHKRKIIKEKMESVLNSSITAYSKRLGNYNYKMPKLSEEEWQRIYSNISVITFFQGKNIGLTKYNGYCVLNSTNSNEYVNPNLMYFINGGEYHDIRCHRLKELGSTIKGYRIGAFEAKQVPETDENGEQVIENNRVKYKYEYDHNELACYSCVNGQLENYENIYDYVRNTSNDYLKKSYFTSLARERYNQRLQINMNIPVDAIEYNGHFYYAYKQDVTWEKAKENCKKLGGHLATITSQEEQDVIFNMIKNTGNNYWLGGTDSQGEGTWKWITGEDFSYREFGTGQPDNFGRERTGGFNNTCLQ